MTTEVTNRRYSWRISHQLIIAGALLLFPLLTISFFFLNQKAEEIDQLELQIQKTRLIEPTYTLLREVTTHRGMLALYLQ